MNILNKINLSKLGIFYYGKKSDDSIVHYNGATYRKLHAPIVCNIKDILKCELNKFKMTKNILKLIQNCIYIYIFIIYIHIYTTSCTKYSIEIL